MSDIEKKIENETIEEKTTTKIEENSEIVEDSSIRPGKMLKRWFLTYNNPTESDEEMVEYIKNLEHIKYAIFQREKGHECETEHFQMFLIPFSRHSYYKKSARDFHLKKDKTF